MSTWSEHLSLVRGKNKEKSLKECMQIASQSWNGNSSKKDMGPRKEITKTNHERKYVDKDPKYKSTKKNIKAECKETLSFILGLSKDLLKVTAELSERDLKSLKKAEVRISKIHDSFNDSASSSNQESEECSSDDS